ncbi:PD-(D/E)XK nuclease family protein [Flavobacterium capsici]|uniref:PD-(D/E)XK nuclease family protein n=1 Tax=Flavobacterium capsici TaxID=3075618 RepID=A0AA96J8N0_9FLAO|nr:MULTISPECIES: PD-(D/E)XK nuclease family protein [unclassified Flavobacterium]WNM19544.1 PD-(D/E)XK nuclease family protein [Flavobacterium sp. PMR2A8]WNM20933.1 PD-(D/E)XK nuclease family protein [Flavobacterium sp. PMTSA4]
MSKPTFLNQLANTIITNYPENLSDCIIVLPNKRAKVFLINELQNITTKTIFAPDIISIEEFVQNISGIRNIDSVELLFEFYNVYCSIEEKNKLDEFESFANWAKTLLQDFNEIDRYLLEPDKILKYLENIKEIEHWSVDINKKTELIEKHLLFWKKLPHYYHSLYKHLYNKGIGYQGLIYREATENLTHFSDNLKNEKFIFAGFNALNQAEEKIIQHLLAIDKAEVYWDLDEVFLKDELHDAGLFQRKFKKEWNFYKNNPYQWVAKDFAQQKTIEIISTPKAIGQAKIVGNIIEQHCETENLQNVAIILGEENLLLPILYSLPKNVDALNITMGFSSKNNPAQLLISKFFKLHVNTTNRNSSSYTMYFKDVLDVLTNPLIEPYIDAYDLVNRINRNNFSFISLNKLHELYGKENELFQLLFQKWDTNPVQFLENIAQILLYIKSKLNRDNEEEKITNAFIYSIYKVINKLISYLSNQNSVTDLKTLFAIYKQVVEVAEVSFEGEPLEGLQIMGVLESRVLDFETVIITSVNEGKFPAGKSNNSFIPYDVKREYGLPTYKEKDAIYTYHFYHLLQRAKNIYLLYNSDSDGFDAGEKSRFITQLEIEKQPNHTLKHTFYNPIVPAVANELMVIEKSEQVQNRLKEIAETGFSPSSLTSYIRNPIQFYFQRILRIKETDEVEENIAVNTLGTIIHGTLEELYKPFLNLILTVDDIDEALFKTETEVLIQFKKVYKEGDIKTGRNLLAYEVAKRNVENFLKAERKEIENGAEIQVLSLETTYQRTIEDNRLPFPVLIKGNVDRIELRDGKIRIIDYKTGKVEQKNVSLSDWNGLTDDIKNDKIIQVLAYAFMYEPEAKNREIEVGIVSFKNMKAGFLPFNYKVDKVSTAVITPEIMESYLDQIVTLLLEIFDKDKPFEERV